MYKILNSQGLGVSGRQNELIELALTYGFDGVEVDMVDLLGRHDALGKAFACQFLQSASTDMGTFHLPIDLGGSEAQYQASFAKLETIIDLAQTLNAKQCYIKIQPVSQSVGFKDNFQQHQSRLQQIGEKLEAANIRLGLALQASAAKKAENAEGEPLKFIQTAEELLALIKAVANSSVGLCLDCWEWVVGGGTLDHLKAIDVNQVLTEVRLADVTSGVALSEAAKKDRTALPGDEPDSFSYALMQHLLAEKYDGPISVSTAQVTFLDELREKIVNDLSQRLNLLMAGEDPAAIAEGEAADANRDDSDESAALAAGSEG